jgi:twitching motility two-component system response regulator PilG
VDRAPPSVRPYVVSRSSPSRRAPAWHAARDGPRALRQLEGRSLPTVNGSNAKLQGLKVLVIDDSKTIRRTAETLLAKEGCEVYTAIDGFDALAKIADHQPDIVFVDIMMPRLDGYQTCSLIKHNKVFRSIPVIMLSSKDGLFDRARGRIVGSEHYLTKPFTKDELLSAIETHIGR